MNGRMTEAELAIRLLCEKVDKSVKSEDALRFTQAALNIAHVLATLNTTGVIEATTVVTPVSVVDTSK
jgi:hypothetical protein